MQNLRCNGDRYLCSYGNFHIIIPGSSGIPEWVTRKSMEYEVSIELSENWYEDDNFLGFALFFHLLPLDGDDDNNNDDVDDKFKGTYLGLSTSHGDQYGLILGFADFSECGMYFISSLDDICSHMEFSVHHKVSTSDPTLGVLYVPQIAISTKYRSREWNHFEALCNPTYRCGDKTFKVKSCGIHLLYAQQKTTHIAKYQDMSNIFSL